MHPTKLTFLVLPFATLIACVDPEVAPEIDELATDEQEIINGGAVSAETIRNLGLATVGGGCSGVLYSNNWILTAGHCVSQASQTSTWVRYNGTSRVSDRVYRFGGYNDAQGPDLAMIHVANPFNVGGSTTGYLRGLYVSSHENMSNRNIDLYGRGQNTVAGAGSGTWRTGNVAVTAATNDMLSYTPNASGQTGWFGDSGGPSFADAAGSPAIVGIQSGVSWTCSPSSPPGQCLSQTPTGGSQVFLSQVMWGMLSVMNTPWNAAQSVQFFDTTGHEIRVARETEVDLNLAPWAQLARVATELCANRGFAAGRYNGHQWQGRYGLACSSAGTTWYDATPSEINATGWGFYDHNQTHWAQVARAAFGVCQAKGHVSGFFTGYQILGSKYGVNCLSGNVQHMDAYWHELNQTGWRVDDVGHTGYAHALRAANEFCKHRGFVTGFMNGHQSQGRYGVTCQR